MSDYYHEIFVPTMSVLDQGGPEVFKEFEAKNKGVNSIVFPYHTIQELETLKGKGSLAADEVLGFLKDTITEENRKGYGRKDKGITIYHGSGGLDIVLMNEECIKDTTNLYRGIEQAIIDNLDLQGQKKPVFISSKKSEHIFLTDYGLRVEDPLFLIVNADILNEGIINGNNKLYQLLKESEGSVPLDQAEEILGRELFYRQFICHAGPAGYEYAQVRGEATRNSAGEIVELNNMRVDELGEREYRNKQIHTLRGLQKDIWGIQPRDMKQYLALEYFLFNPDVTLSFICGDQGSGKTILSYIAAIDHILWYKGEQKDNEWQGRKRDKKKKKHEASPHYEDEEGAFKRIVLIKATDIMGGHYREVGFLPGSLYSKLEQNLRSFLDAHGESHLQDFFPFEDLFLHPLYKNSCGNPRKDRSPFPIEGIACLPRDHEAVELTYSGFVRGRTFNNCIVIVDEAENFSPYELKTIIERTGENSKTIILGDPAQMDNPCCSRNINGLTHGVKHFLGKPYVGLIKLSTNYRSQASRDAIPWKVYSDWKIHSS